MKKKFMLTAEVDNGDRITVFAENEGFTAFEIIGILQDKIIDIHKQLHEEKLYEHRRSYKDEDGGVFEIKEMRADDDR